MYPVTYKPE